MRQVLPRPLSREAGEGSHELVGNGRPEAGRFARNSMFGTLAGATTAFGSVLCTVIVAHALGVEAMGVVSFALLVVMVAVNVADLGVPQTLARYMPELIAAGRAAEAERLAGFLSRPLLALCGLALAGTAAYAVWEWRSAGTWPAEATIWAIVAAICALQTLGGITYGRLRGAQRFAPLAALTAASVAVQVAGIAAGSLLFGVVGALGGVCVGSALPALFAFRSRRVRGTPVAELRGRAVRYAAFAWAAALSSTVVWSRAEVFFLQRWWGSAAVGLFAVGLTLANIAAQGPMLLTAALLPRFAQSFGEGALDRMRDGYAAGTRILAFLVLPACFGIAALLPSLLPLIFGRSFADAVPAATVMVLAAGAGSIAYVGSSLIMAMDRSDFIFLSGAVAAVLTILAGFTIIPAFGLMGAAWARAAIQTATVAFGIWFLMSRLRCPFPYKVLSKLLLAAAICGAAARLCLLAVPGPAALPLAIAAGAAIYLALVRVLRALPLGDIEKLGAVAGLLPGPLAGPVEAVLRFLDGDPLSGRKPWLRSCGPG